MDTIRKHDGFMSQRLIVLPEHVMTEYAQHPLVRPLYITDIGYFPRALHHYRERPDGSAAYIVIYCVEGSGWYRLDGQRRQSLHKGCAVVIPAYMAHEYASSEEQPWSIYWWHMRGEQVADFFTGFNRHSEPILIPALKSLKLIELFEECYMLLDKGYSLRSIIYVSQLACHLAAILAFSQLAPSAGTGPQQRAKHDIDRTLTFMSGHLEQTVTLKELAAQANLSVPHFTQLFKQATGYPPIDYYLRLKIQLACQHLDLTGQSIKEISLRLGFQDPYYFSRLFKKIMGLPPTEYRNTRKG
ncbi:AraC family transcriptional regulator [Paenibacillus donghaensis]|uniref:AraC family transcriptional regulator n=1 Tax=Paenibacillus donghaensis TaxID=414771 RepID=A0A2Z2KAK5_9BACL|nr:AraC family transcriptional regulator [Paenibacillus donghaensis]ASA19940.1 AraC family transcriptional regulator [Paenibacillus donghaensis]